MYADLIFDYYLTLVHSFIPLLLLALFIIPLICYYLLTVPLVTILNIISAQYELFLVAAEFSSHHP
jgi:hypothetical protein